MTRASRLFVLNEHTRELERVAAEIHETSLAWPDETDAREARPDLYKRRAELEDVIANLRRRIQR